MDRGSFPLWVLQPSTVEGEGYEISRTKAPGLSELYIYLTNPGNRSRAGSSKCHLGLVSMFANKEFVKNSPIAGIPLSSPPWQWDLHHWQEGRWWNWNQLWAQAAVPGKGAVTVSFPAACSEEDEDFLHPCHSYERLLSGGMLKKSFVFLLSFCWGNLDLRCLLGLSSVHAAQRGAVQMLFQ